MPQTTAIALIPARGGSKRIPRKNIRPFAGVPMLARTVSLLIGSRAFDRIVVSTDDDEIAAVAREAGAEVPFKRPPELSNDMAATVPVIQHAIRTLSGAGVDADLVCCVYPAAVLADPADISRGLQILRETSADYAFSATSFPFPIQRALRKMPDDGCQMFWPEHRQTRSQDLEPAFHDAGQFYWGRREAWLEARPIFAEASRMIVIPHYRVQDIDTLEDWNRAEFIFELLQRGR